MQGISWNKTNIREIRFFFASSIKLENASNFTQDKQNYQNQFKYYGNQKEYIMIGYHILVIDNYLTKLNKRYILIMIEIQTQLRNGYM